MIFDTYTTLRKYRTFRRSVHRKYLKLMPTTRIPFLTYALGKKWGRTEWWKFTVIHLFATLDIVTPALMPMDYPWVLPVIGTIILVFSWNGTYQNWKLDRDPPENPNHHRNDVTHEGTEFPVMVEPFGAPIMNLNVWVVARYQVSMEEATEKLWEDGRDGPLHQEYDLYLQDKRFDRFL